MKAVPGLNATLAIARLSGKRFIRSKILFAGIFFLFMPFLPILFGAGASRSPDFRWEHFLRLSVTMQMLVTALYTSQVIAEEIENKTYAYLWSRPIPRWTVLIGKLIIGLLAATALSIFSVVGGSAMSGFTDPAAIARTLMAVTLGVVTVGFVASALGTLIPKYAMAVSISYFLFLDNSLSIMPFAIARISVRHNVTSIAGYGDNAGTIATSVLWLLGTALFWAAISLRKLARKEFSTGS